MNLYLVRHGQAGRRDDYDTLSPLGLEQAQLLGAHLREQGVTFATAYVGGLARQQQTAEAVGEAYGEGFPEWQSEPGWSEFSLDDVYRDLAPQISATDPGFARDFAAMQEQIRQSAGAANAAVHRRWLPCDVRIIQEWIAGRYLSQCESWQQFHNRVTACQPTSEQGGDVIVFTSATPAAIWAAQTLNITDGRVMLLAGAHV